MAALHDALKTLGPFDFADAPLDGLQPFLSDAFTKGQLIVDSVPIPAPSGDSIAEEARSRASSNASNASEISLSSARSAPPPSDVEALQKEWKQIKLNARDNPLGMSVYKLGGKDGKGSWFARRSVHEGLGFTKWKRGLEREFPETMKVQGGPGEGNIRGIGGEKRVEYKNVDGVGKLEVYLLSAQFPGPTTPRDFVTMFLTSDQALSDTHGKGQEVPRHFMVISRPCNHPDTPPRDGYIRGQYESVEFIREIPLKKGPKKSLSTTNLAIQGASRNRSASALGREAILRNAQKNHVVPLNENDIDSVATDTASDSEITDLPSEPGRARGKTISFSKSRGIEAKGEDMDVPRDEDECESNPIEWIMITRSDPGGSVPRFMIERGTPGGIVADASKFLNWACAKEMEDLESDDEDETAGNDQNQDENAQRRDSKHHHSHDNDLFNFQTNGHLSGLEELPLSKGVLESDEASELNEAANSKTIYGMAADVAAAAGPYIASHTPTIISDHLPSIQQPNGTSSSPPRRESTSSISSVSSAESFASALEGYSSDCLNDTSSTKTTNSAAQALTMTSTSSDKELQKLEEKKRKLEEKLAKAKQRETNRRGEGSAKEEEAIRKVQERHEREMKKRDEKYRKDIEKLAKKKEREALKTLERKRKAEEKDEKTKMQREMEELKAEVGLLRKEKDILRGQVGDLQAENTALAARVGKLTTKGDEVLRDIRTEVEKSGRMRASSLKGLARPASFISRSSTFADKRQENEPPTKA